MGKLRMPRLLHDGMVLQQKREVHIWGWDEPGRMVTVCFRGMETVETEAKTDAAGNFSLYLPSLSPGGPFCLTVRDSAKEEVVMTDVWVGDVWFCAGQSNMELPMSWVAPYYEEEIADCDNPAIRTFKITPHAEFHAPFAEPLSGKWKAANRGNILQFSACAYFFAKKWYEQSKVPTGILNVSLGGAKIEAFMSKDMLAGFDDCLLEAFTYADDCLRKSRLRKNEEDTKSWYEKLNQEDRGIINGWQRGEAWNQQPARQQKEAARQQEEAARQQKEAAWQQKEAARQQKKAAWQQEAVREQEMEVPCFLRDTVYAGMSGSLWLERTFCVPESFQMQDTILRLGTLVDADEVYVNGKLIGCTAFQYPERRYRVEAGTLKEGENTLVIRLIIEQGEGRITPGKPLDIGTPETKVSLAGTYRVRVGADLQKKPPVDFVESRATGLYNGMVAPCHAYTIAGFLWYQGEANAHMPGAESYADKMKRLITGFRKQWQEGDLPFCYVQLPDFKIGTYYGNEEERSSDWDALRAQQESVLSLKNTGMIRTMDIGEENDLHPHNKKEVGERLALLADRLY